MTNAQDHFLGSMPGLPDPDADRQFYAQVPSRRLVAWFVDLAVIVGICLVVVPLVGVLTLGFGFMFIPIIATVVSFIYRTITITNASATWGMRLMGIEFRRADGTRFDLGTAFLHTAIYTVCFTVLLLQFASIVAVLATRYQQTLPDLVLRTTAINAPED